MIQNKRLPWMNVYWLKKRLGPAVLSNPEQTSANPSQLEYTWHCRENEELYLSVMTNAEGLVTEVNGQYTSEEGAAVFSATLPQNKMTLPPPPIQTAPTLPTIAPPSQPKEKIITPPPPVKKEMDSALSKLLRPYNEAFQLSLESKDQLATDMMNKIKIFYTSMRNCTAGIFRYAIYLQSGFIFPVSTIEGEKNGSCKVNTVFTVPKVGEINARCEYKIKDLTVYTDEEAETLIKGKSFDKKNPSARDKAEAASCETYINGKLQPKLI